MWQPARCSKKAATGSFEPPFKASSSWAPNLIWQNRHGQVLRLTKSSKHLISTSSAVDSPLCNGTRVRALEGGGARVESRKTAGSHGAECTSLTSTTPHPQGGRVSLCSPTTERAQGEECLAATEIACSRDSFAGSSTLVSSIKTRVFFLGSSPQSDILCIRRETRQAGVADRAPSKALAALSSNCRRRSSPQDPSLYRLRLVDEAASVGLGPGSQGLRADLVLAVLNLVLGFGR